MPTYAYACTECDHRFEAVQSFTDSSLSECPECTGRLRKLFSSVGIVFKGSGFYRTDSRKSASAADLKDKPSSDSSTSSTSTPAKTSNPPSSTSGGSSEVKAAS